VRLSVHDGSLLITPEGDAEYELLRTLIGMRVDLHWGSVVAVPEGITTGAVLGDKDVLGHVAVGALPAVRVGEGEA
jgi:hypothetical protein